MNAISTLSTATLTPMISKSADVVGRAETLIACVLSYVIGKLIWFVVYHRVIAFVLLSTLQKPQTLEFHQALSGSANVRQALY